MDLAAKPDAETCLDRVEAWWDGRIVDRPPVCIGVRPERPARPVPAPGGSIRRRWLDVEHVLERAAAAIEAGVFLAESFPKFVPNVGPEVCATAYGCELEFTDRTSWSVPCAGSIREVLDLRPDLETPYWTVIRRMTEASLQRGAGRWITAVADLHTNGDLLAALRDPQALALDFADDLDGVRAACRHVRTHFAAFFDDLHDRIRAAGQPCCTWGIAISRRRCYYASCDFICMISPKMLADTILPVLQWEIRRLDRSIFHLDGPGALVHLDALLELPELNAVQWTYGAGSGPGGRWIDVYRRIQQAGKGIEVHAADLDDARAIMENLRPEGVWLSVGGQYDRPTAEAFLAETARWAAGGR